MNSIKTKILGLLLFTGCIYTTSKAQQTRTVADFTGIKAGDSFTINLSQSDANSVKVNAPESIQPQIKTEVKDGILIISSEGNMKNDEDITISVSIKSLNSLDISGAAELKSENQLICEKLNITSNGAGDVHIDVKATELRTDISGAGDVTIKGTAQSMDATVAGAGSLKASGLEVAKAKVKVSGAGDAKVYAGQSLDADVSGAGSVIYKGNPVDRNVNISGAGSVRESKSGSGDETASDTTKFKLGNKKYMIIDGDKKEAEEKLSKKDSSRNYNDDFKNWSGFEIGVNGMLDFNNKIDLPANASFLELDYGKSLQFGLNLFEKDFHIYKNYVNIVAGFGFDFNHYAFQNSITLNGDTTYLMAWSDSTIDYKKNKLNVTYIKVPLMLEFNTSKNSNKNLHIAVGAEVAYRINSYTKQKYEADGDRHKIKHNDDYNLEPFRYSAVARIGYNDITVFANYGLNRLFKKDKGPQVYPFTVGIGFTM
jgi:putative autotransporter adhesin-like protein/outer membrane protein with beta-barrel domain